MIHSIRKLEKNCLKLASKAPMGKKCWLFHFLSLIPLPHNLNFPTVYSQCIHCTHNSWVGWGAEVLSQNLKTNFCPDRDLKPWPRNWQSRILTTRPSHTPRKCFAAELHHSKCFLRTFNTRFITFQESHHAKEDFSPDVCCFIWLFLW